MRPDAETRDRLARIGAALPTVNEFRPYAPELCPKCGDEVWIAPMIDGTGRVYCIGCGWAYTIEVDR